MIKYILIFVMVVSTIVYEAWSQKKARESEWYLKNFRDTVLSFLSEIRSEPEATRKMIRKLAFEDIEKAIENEKSNTLGHYHQEQMRDYKDRDTDLLCNLSGRADGLDFALQLIRDKKPKSYRDGFDKNADPTMPKEIQKVYRDSIDNICKDMEKQIVLDGGFNCSLYMERDINGNMTSHSNKRR